MHSKNKFIVIWVDPNNTIQRKGGLEYKGKTIFKTLEEAQEAIYQDKLNELEYNPKSQMTWHIYNLDKD